MSWRRPPSAACAALVVAFAAALRLGNAWDTRLQIHPVNGQLLASQASAEEVSTNDRATQRLRLEEDRRSAEYSFLNFNQDRISVVYELRESDFRKYDNAFGYRDADITELKTWRERARRDAYRLAVKLGRSQVQLDAAVEQIDKDHLKKLQDHLASRGFRLERGNLVRVDMPAIVRNNTAAMRPLSLAFARIAARRRYLSADIIGAALSLVQTAMHYRQPEPVYGGKHTGGILPPVTALLLGWGDCDTKTAVLAAILANWTQMRMIGVSVPGHYLMAVLQIPDKGDLFIEYQGLQYLLLEPAGPAWLPPGRVAEETVAQLSAQEGYKIESFF